MVDWRKGIIVKFVLDEEFQKRRLSLNTIYLIKTFKSPFVNLDSKQNLGETEVF